jgi:hypothetical protein
MISKQATTQTEILNCSHLNFQLEPPVYLSENRLLNIRIAEIHSAMRISTDSLK